MAFVYSSPISERKSKLDIIFIPAIGADPRATFARKPDQAQSERIDTRIHDELCVQGDHVHVHLYDHLRPNERSTTPLKRLSYVVPEDKHEVDHTLNTEKAIATYGVDDWATRLLETIKELRKRRNTVHRPIIFICHSTGGNVLKKALIERTGTELNEVARNTVAITFFAVPHHGSSVLSKGQYVKEVQAQLGLHFGMSSRLRQDFRLRNQNRELQTLNHRFAVDLSGVKIHSYAETADTLLTLLTSAKRGAEDQETVFRECIVDSRSGKLGTSQVPVNDEEFMQLDTTHVGTPRFAGQDDQIDLYLTAIKELVKGYNERDRIAHRVLKDSILQGVKVHVHQFFEGDDDRMKILLAKPTLEAFLQFGPDKAMAERLEGRDTDLSTSDHVPERPQFMLHPPSELKDVPTFKVETVENDRSSDEHTPDRLTPPQTPIPKNIHTHRPPEMLQPQSQAESKAPPVQRPNDKPENGKLGPGSNTHMHPKAVRFSSGTRNVDSPGPKPSKTMRLPEEGLSGFRWIHCPFTHPGWVHTILGAIAEDRKNQALHDHLLKDKIWISQHNQSRHQAPHSRFVRPASKFLFPKGPENVEGRKMIPSSCGDVQTVVYLPYLHWDSYANMEKREDIIAKRLKQGQSSVPDEITRAKSIEHKLIWQGLMLERPLHCRRTLDQYGYPALRNTSVRDHDQILWKRTKIDAPIPKVLMVDQLWIWIIDGKTVVTFFPGREDDNFDGYSREADVRSLIYQDINGDYANRCDSPYDFAALAIRHATRALLAKATDRTLQVFSIFEEYISIQTENQNKSWKLFRNLQGKKLKDINTEEHVSNKDDIDALLELRDIEDELNTIDKLLREQVTVINDLLNTYTNHLNPMHLGLKGTEFLYDTATFLQDQQTQVASMRESTSAAQGAYKDLVDMKQKQANVLEARLAGRQSQVAAQQSRAVLIFTIFTIIFLPLSFFASVFGINSKEWSGDDNNYLPLRDIFTYMLSISLGCIVLALLAAFSRSARRHTQRLWRRVGSYLVTPASEPDNASQSPSLQTSGMNSSRRPSKFWAHRNDPEKHAPDAATARNDITRLSVQSRTQSFKARGEKFEREMGGRGGSLTKQGKRARWWDGGHGWGDDDEENGSDALDWAAIKRDDESDSEGGSGGRKGSGGKGLGLGINGHAA